MSLRLVQPLLYAEPPAPPEPVSEDMSLIIDCRKALNPELLSVLDRADVSNEIVRDLVCALDIFHEIVTDANFISGYLLNSPDTMADGYATWQIFRSTDRKFDIPHPKPIAVSQHFTDLQQELFDYNYLHSIDTVLRALRLPGFDATLDNHTTAFIGLSRQTVHPEYGIVRYQDLGTGRNTSIPFKLSRLTGE